MRLRAREVDDPSNPTLESVSPDCRPSTPAASSCNPQTPTAPHKPVIKPVAPEAANKPPEGAHAAYAQDFLHGIVEVSSDLPAQIPEFVQNTIAHYPKQAQANACIAIAQQVPKVLWARDLIVNSLPEDARRDLRTEEATQRQQYRATIAEQRKVTKIQYLDNTWGARQSWMPEDLFPSPTPGQNLVAYMYLITIRSIEQGIDLLSLYSPGGLLRDAVSVDAKGVDRLKIRDLQQVATRLRGALEGDEQDDPEEVEAARADSQHPEPPPSDGALFNQADSPEPHNTSSYFSSNDALFNQAGGQQHHDIEPMSLEGFELPPDIGADINIYDNSRAGSAIFGSRPVSPQPIDDEIIAMTDALSDIPAVAPGMLPDMNTANENARQQLSTSGACLTGDTLWALTAALTAHSPLDESVKVVDPVQIKVTEQEGMDGSTLPDLSRLNDVFASNCSNTLVQARHYDSIPSVHRAEAKRPLPIQIDPDVERKRLCATIPALRKRGTQDAKPGGLSLRVLDSIRTLLDYYQDKLADEQDILEAAETMPALEDKVRELRETAAVQARIVESTTRDLEQKTRQQQLVAFTRNLEKDSQTHLKDYPDVQSVVDTMRRSIITTDGLEKISLQDLDKEVATARDAANLARAEEIVAAAALRRSKSVLENNKAFQFEQQALRKAIKGLEEARPQGDQWASLQTL
ncbi:hypothetical protein CSOJ01_15144 [Colletotrichum sojae]|uniref:Uncharacterized protein n=1 Tax=Colletotrichum sojae TaxID=2175907 RepID=A0A8H6IP94_9PEZI|nr:hypothetical protein CSOJ01_15144 [Colletotrichum sojae]